MEFAGPERIKLGYTWKSTEPQPLKTSSWLHILRHLFGGCHGWIGSEIGLFRTHKLVNLFPAMPWIFGGISSHSAYWINNHDIFAPILTHDNTWGWSWIEATLCLFCLRVGFSLRNLTKIWTLVLALFTSLVSQGLLIDTWYLGRSNKNVNSQNP